MKLKHGLLLGVVWGAIGMAQSATAAEIKVLTTGAFKQVVVALVPEFEKATGHKVVLDNGTVGQLQKRVDGGEAFDVLVLSPKGIEDYIKSGKIAAGSNANLAKVGVGVMVKEGAPKPDISSVEAFKQALLKAKSVGYIDPASGGSSGIYVAGLLDKLGIADQIKPKAKLQKGGHVSDLVKAGEAEIGIHQISEIVGQAGRDAGRAAAEGDPELHHLRGRGELCRKAGGGGQGLHQGAHRAFGRGRAEVGWAWKGPDAPKRKRPPGGRALSEGPQRRLALRAIPGHARNVAAGDADVGQFAIAEPIQLAKALVVAAPLPEDANQMSEEHGINPLRGRRESPVLMTGT